MHHAVSDEPVVLRWVDVTNGVGSVAKVSTIKFTRQCACDVQVSDCYLIAHRSEVPLEERIPFVVKRAHVAILRERSDEYFRHARRHVVIRTLGCVTQNHTLRVVLVVVGLVIAASLPAYVGAFHGVQVSVRGEQGERGPVGPKGERGVQGAPGADGRDGNDGQRGVRGPQGARGLTGEVGAMGPMGLPGVDGVDGSSGAQGPTGATGLTGATGATGPPGPTGATGPAGGFGAYGSFYDTTTVSLPQNVVTPVSLNTTDFARDVSIVDSSKITFAVAGKFNIMFSSQIEKADAGTDTMSVWLSKNSQNVPWSNTDVVITSSGANSRHLVMLNYFVDAVSGDFFQVLMTSTTSSQMVIRSVGAQTNPARPEIPSTILTVNQVG